MKKIYNFLVALLIVVNILANGKEGYKNSPTLKVEANQWIQSQPVQFLENKGQMTDMNGKPVPFVLFKSEAPGMNMYVTEMGVTYVFVKIEDEVSSKRQAEWLSTGQTNEKEGTLLNTTPVPIDEGQNRKIEWSRIDMNLQGATIKKENIIRETPSVTDFNFFYGHCPDGIYGVKKYEKITIKNIYTGIDWVLYNSNEKGFKYDFIVHPGADYKQIELIYKSKTPIRINKQGELELYTQHGNVKENTPVSFYEGREIITRFRQNYQKPIEINNDKGYETSVSFHLISHISHLTSLLTIDPQLVWATYFGGTTNNSTGFNSTTIRSIDCDLNNNLFVVGSTTSNLNFPLLNPFGGVYFDGTTAGGWRGLNDDTFISKFDNTGKLLWSTYYGGSSRDDGQSIAVDLNNNVFVTGKTISSDFPTQNAFGTTYFQGPMAGIGVFKDDIFVLKFNNAGVRLWATCYGGSDGDVALSICTDPIAGNVFVTGETNSFDFPVLNPGAPAFYHPSVGGNITRAYILKFDNTGTRLWATNIGGTNGASSSGYSICSDAAGNIFVTGGAFKINYPAPTDFPFLNPGGGAYFETVANPISYNWTIFILKFSNAGQQLWGTFYGGATNTLGIGYTICADHSGNVFVTGVVGGNIPVLNPGSGAYFQPTVGSVNDAFILKFSNGGVRLWATHYGGTGQEYQSFGAYTYTYDNIAVDPCNNVYISFHTNSSNAPVQDELVQNSCSAGFYKNTTNCAANTFITKFSNAGTRLWASYFTGDQSSSGNMEALAVDKFGNLFMAGQIELFQGTKFYFPPTNPGGLAYYDGNNSLARVCGYIAKFIPAQASYIQSQVNNTSCTPCNGSATITVNCSNPNYSYVWSNGSSTLNSSIPTNTISGLCPGTYTVTATSNCNQTQIATFVIAGTPCGTCTLTGQYTKGTSNCAGCGCKEWIMINATGGTSPYSYTWPDGYTNRYKNQLCPGNYTINIKDKNGCSVNVNLTTP